MSMAKNKFVCTFLGGADAGSFSIGYRRGLNGIGIIIVENKNVVIAATGDRWELSSLVRVQF